MNTSDITYKIDDFINYINKKDDIEGNVVIGDEESGFSLCGGGNLSSIKRDKENKDKIYIFFGQTHLWINIADIIKIEECTTRWWRIHINTEFVKRLEFRQV